MGNKKKCNSKRKIKKKNHRKRTLTKVELQETMKNKTKSKLGAGMKIRAQHNNKKHARKTKEVIPLKTIINKTRKSMQSTNENPIKTALRAAREAVKRVGGRKNIQSPQILSVPTKVGGILPAFLIPLFAGLSATGALAGGAAGIAKAVNDAKSAKQQLQESARHNKTMEAIAIGKGLHLKRYRAGLGLHLQPYPKNP